MYLYASDTGCAVIEETLSWHIAWTWTIGNYSILFPKTILTCSLTSYNLPYVTNEIRGELVNPCCLFIVAWTTLPTKYGDSVICAVYLLWHEPPYQPNIEV